MLKSIPMKKVLPSYSFVPSEETLERIKTFYEPWRKESPSEFIDFFAQDEGYTLSIYKRNKKGEVKVLFQGIKAVEEASIFDPEARNESVQPTLPRRPVKIPTEGCLYPQIGSDEVGTGDFFGPIIVCSAYIKESDLPRLKELGVTDSKAMSDDHILEIGPSLIKEFEYSQLALPNEKYNLLHDEMNMNAMKAKMHNRALLNLKLKHQNAHVYQDQFAEEKTYYHYLEDEPEVLRGIVFKTKGETHYPSVALASVIARYSFLRKMKDLGDKYGIEFPKGAGEEVDAFAQAFKDKFGIQEFKKIAKINFANFKKII